MELIGECGLCHGDAHTWSRLFLFNSVLVSFSTDKKD